MFYYNKPLVILDDFLFYLKRHPKIPFEITIAINGYVSIQIKSHEYETVGGVKYKEGQMWFVFFMTKKPEIQI